MSVECLPIPDNHGTEFALKDTRQVDIFDMAFHIVPSVARTTTSSADPFAPPPLEQQLKQLLIIFVKISRTDETNAGYWQSLKVVRSLDNLRREFFDWF